MKATALGFGTSALLVLFFSPSWVSFAAWSAFPAENWDLVAVRRGVTVMQQVEDPTAEIRDPIHAITRWRLLFPAVGHVLHLPPAFVLSFSPLGCAIVLSLLVHGARRRAYPWRECTLLAIVLGSASWFFVSTGWLGYFDSWLLLGLLAVSFAGHHSAVLAACLLTPWVDERFVIGFPLALLVRWLDRARNDPSPSSLIDWLRHDAGAPILVVSVVVLVRVGLAGRGASEGLAAYAEKIAFLSLSAERLAFGAWEGLRIGWLLVLAAVVRLARDGHGFGLGVLALGTLATTLVGLAAANDLSRSAALAAPVVVLGWDLIRTTDLWVRVRLGWLFAGAALLLPAHHVVSDFVMPVDRLWVELRILLDSGLVDRR